MSVRTCAVWLVCLGLLGCGGAQRRSSRARTPGGSPPAVAVLLSIDQLRAALRESPSRENPRTLLADLSYADIAMAQVVASVRFPSAGLRLGSAGRAAFESPRLAELYPDLIGWRDALYAHYRFPKVGAA